MFVLLSSQENWSKGMYPVVEFIHQCGSKCIKVLEAMERHGTVYGGTFKCTEGINVPEDWHQLAAELLDETIRPTSARVRAVADDIIRRRHWSWCLLHPELDDKYMHPSRSMHPSLFAADCYLFTGNFGFQLECNEMMTPSFVGTSFRGI